MSVDWPLVDVGVKALRANFPMDDGGLLGWRIALSRHDGTTAGEIANQQWRERVLRPICPR